MMRTINGSALVDYVIPTLVVGVIAGVGLYTMHSSGVLKNFIAASLNIEISDDGEGVVGDTVGSGDMIALVEMPDGITMSTITAGDLGGTSEQPIKSCEGNVCAIDFGDFILTDIPENFASEISTNGSHIGTQVISDLFSQMADQLDDPDTPEDEGAYLKLLSQQAKFIADQMNSQENLISTSCPTGTTGCTYTPPGTSSTPSNESLGDIRNMKIDGDSIYTDNISTNPLYGFLDTYDKIQNSSDSQYTDSIKSITKELFVSLDSILYNFQQSSSVLNDGEVKNYYADPITGNTIENNDYTVYQDDGVTEKTDYELTQEVLHPQADLFADLNSVLICTTGSYDDTGQTCNTK